MAATAAFPGVFFCFAAMVLLLFVSVSVPTWHAVSFLNVGPGGPDQLRYGVFGYTGSKISVGYDFTDAHVNSTKLHNLTFVLILHPIAAGLSFFAFLFGLCGLSYHRWGTIFMTLSSGVAFILTFIAWIVDMSLFGVARNRYRDSTTAQYGNAIWMTLGALVALFLAAILACCGVLGNYRKRRSPTSY